MKTFLSPLAAIALLAGAPLAVAPLLLVGPACAAPTDPAAVTVDTFDNALVAVMKEGGAIGAKGRARRLTPAVQGAFDLPFMTRVAVGPPWTSMSPAQQESLVKAFTRLSVASYAHNFDSYSGQRFDIQAVQTRGADKIVQCRLISPHDASVALIYRLRQTSAGWRIVDVYYDNISQLTTRRADFAAPLASGGAAGLMGHLDALTEKLLR